MRVKIFTTIIFFSILMNGVSVKSQVNTTTLIKGITIYIDYPDKPRPAAFNDARLDSLINGTNYQEASIPITFREYWRTQSRNNIDIEHDIFFYTAPLTAKHYGTLTGPEGILLWRDALEYVIANNPSYDWNALTKDSGGALRSTMIISSAWGPAGVGASRGINWTLTNGVKIKFIYASVLTVPWQSYDNMFMTLHEAGHGVFGFPDLWDTSGTSYGAQPYSIMAGNQTVAPVGGPLLVNMNWVDVIEPTPGTTNITLRYDGDSVVVFRNIYDPHEFYTIEARRRSTIGNSSFPVDSGLIIWHTDDKVATSNTLEQMTRDQHYKHSVVQADGLFELERKLARGNAGDIYVPGKILNNNSIPNTKWWDGVASNVEINNIQWEGADKISFDITVPEPPNRYSEISQESWKLVSATPSQPGYEGTKAFDGDTTTYYHVPWGNTYPRPHEIVIDLGKKYTINEFYYRANTGLVAPWAGRVADYAVYLSNDGFNWGTAVVSGKFHKTWMRQYTLFPEKTGRYLKFSAISPFENDVRTSIAEINLRGTEAPTAISDQELENNMLKIYPNPVKEILYIQLSIPQKTFVEIYNAAGIVVKKEVINESASINVSGFSKGIYIIKAKTLHKTEEALFIKN